MHYAISDIHGEYDKFVDLLRQIDFSEDDILYVVGDVVDKGPHPIKTLRFMMEHDNIYPIVGNHELMAIVCLRFLKKEINEESVKELDEDKLTAVIDWSENGAASTLNEFYALSMADREKVLKYLGEFMGYEEVEAGGKKYILVHGGFRNFSPERELWDYEIDELVWERPDYSKDYFEDIYVITGHTPTELIENNNRPGYIFRCGKHIAIDCGACFEGGRLAAICLETGEEFYSEV